MSQHRDSDPAPSDARSSDAGDEHAVRLALAEIDAGYTEGDPDRIVAQVADDARLSFVNTPTIEGREDGGPWRVRRSLNQHSRPPHEVA